MEKMVLRPLNYRLFFGVVLSSFLFFSCSKTEEINNRNPEKAVLLIPADKLIDVDIVKPTLEWQSATDPDGDVVAYDLFLDTEENPKSKVIGDLKATSYKLQTDLEINTTYYWRVIAKDGKGGSSESEIHQFTTRERTIQEAIVGQWTMEAVLNDGIPVSLSDCDKKTYYQFNSNGSVSIVTYSIEFTNSPCLPGIPKSGTYTIDNDWNIKFVIGEEDVVGIKVSSITANTLKLMLGSQMVIFKRAL